MKHFNRKTVLAFAAFLWMQGVDAVPASAELTAEEAVQEEVETAGILEETQEISSEEESPFAEQGFFTDVNGITYEWSGYDDGTAEIIGVSFTETEPVVVIPDSIDGYSVTRLTGSIRGASIRELVIPESIAYLGDSVFTDNVIYVLRYNASDADNAQNFFDAPFAGTEVHELLIGEGVETIRGYTFYNTAFREEETALDVPELEEYAFCQSSFERLVLSCGTLELGNLAFAYSDIGALSYRCPDARLYADSTVQAPFYLASIYDLEFSEEVKAIPDYLFANASMKFGAFTFEQERIGDYAFYGAWFSLGLPTSSNPAKRLTIGEEVTYIGKNAFDGCTVEELIYLANAAAGSTGSVSGPFYLADVERLTVGEQVEEIPPYLFAGVSFADVYVEAVGSGKAQPLDDHLAELPSAENLFIHRGSDFYSYFSRNARNVTLYCDDCMTASVGERSWDEKSGKYATPCYETCSVCGYRKVSYTYEDGETDSGQETEEKEDENPNPEVNPGEKEDEKPDPEVNPEKKAEPESGGTPAPEEKQEQPEPGDHQEPEKRQEMPEKQDPGEKPEAGGNPQENPDPEEKPEEKGETKSKEKPALENAPESENPNPEVKRDKKVREKQEERPEERFREKTDSESKEKPDPGYKPETEEEPVPEETSGLEERGTGEQQDSEEKQEPEKKQVSEKKTEEKPKQSEEEPDSKAGTKAVILITVIFFLVFYIHSCCARRRMRVTFHRSGMCICCAFRENRIPNEKRLLIINIRTE